MARILGFKLRDGGSIPSFPALLPRIYRLILLERIGT